MQNNTERRKKKVAPVVMAILVILYVSPLVAVAVLAMVGIIEMGVGPAPMLFILLYLLIGAAMIGGVLIAMRQRLREIDGGEEEDAKKY